jgi:hypothetical protein
MAMSASAASRRRGMCAWDFVNGLRRNLLSVPDDREPVLEPFPGRSGSGFRPTDSGAPITQYAPSGYWSPNAA